jgi:hypothetical protein
VAPAPPPSAAASAAVAAPLDAEPATGGAKTVDKHGKPDKKHHKKTTPGDAASPVDPYTVAPGPPSPPEPPRVAADPPAAAPSALAVEVDKKAASSQGVFDLCKNNFSATGPIHGAIHIAFQILPGGQVTHVTALDNSTGSDPLASCLSNSIASWAFAPHSGDTANFVRAFKYD